MYNVYKWSHFRRKKTIWFFLVNIYSFQASELKSFSKTVSSHEFDNKFQHVQFEFLIGETSDIFMTFMVGGTGRKYLI